MVDDAPPWVAPTHDPVGPTRIAPARDPAGDFPGLPRVFRGYRGLLRALPDVRSLLTAYGFRADRS
ncbi:hypothetical protein ABZ712_12145 [Streptomyces sp. NPDC006906]|uniref:hypothetical protein n=1 Tax=Streptomyces sp. NPDC006906 TaxID=3154782 RepID=UPI0033D975AF